MKVKKLVFYCHPICLKDNFILHIYMMLLLEVKKTKFSYVLDYIHTAGKSRQNLIFFARMTFVFYFLVSKVSFIVDRNWIYIPCFSKLPPSWQYCYIAWESREYTTNTMSNNGRNKHTDTIEGTTSQWPVTLKGQWLGGKPGEWREWQNIQTDININF